MPQAVTGVSAFRHEALLYDGDDAFVAGTVPFVQEGLAAGEAVMVALAPDKLALLRERLGASDAERVRFADMHAIGENPARIIPAWRDFVDEAGASGRQRVRGIGEPVWPGRSDDEVAECHCHEALLNVAFAGADFALLCPYDTAGLAPEVVTAAHETHPAVLELGGVRRESERYGAEGGPLTRPLPEPSVQPATLEFERGRLRDVRGFVMAHALEAGLPRHRADDLLVAANEVATNTLRHGGGSGVVRIWQTDDALVCEIRDPGRFLDPLVGRTRPTAGQIGGYGMWMVNQLCELVQIRSAPSGSVVRMHLAR